MSQASAYKIQKWHLPPREGHRQSYQSLQELEQVWWLHCTWAVMVVLLQAKKPNVEPPNVRDQDSYLSVVTSVFLHTEDWLKGILDKGPLCATMCSIHSLVSLSEDQSTLIHTFEGSKQLCTSLPWGTLQVDERADTLHTVTRQREHQPAPVHRWFSHFRHTHASPWHCCYHGQGYVLWSPMTYVQN